MDSPVLVVSSVNVVRSGVGGEFILLPNDNMHVFANIRPAVQENIIAEQAAIVHLADVIEDSSLYFFSGRSGVFFFLMTSRRMLT